MTHMGTTTGLLAVEGGVPVRGRQLPPWPSFDDDDVAAASRVLHSGQVNYWTGKEGDLFEQEFSSWVGARHAVALANGTVALELCLRALGVGPGDEVIVPAVTFIASASAVVALGATPVVVDVDPQSHCLDADTVAPAIGPRTAAVIVVHLGGWAADVPGVIELAHRHGVAVVEDCAQAHGARRGGRSVGTLGEIAAWSFCQDKILTTAGEGGAVTTQDRALWRTCWELKDHGKDHELATAPPDTAGFRWVHRRFGTNARLSEIQAAVGRVQLTRADDYLATRRRHAETLSRLLADEPALDLPEPPADVHHAWYRFRMRVRPEALGPGWTRDEVIRAVRAEGARCDQGGCAEIQRERAFGDLPARLPVAADIGETCLALPVHPTLSDCDVADLADAVHKVLAVAASRPVSTY